MEATPEQAAEGQVVVRVLAAVLDRLVTANAPLALSDPGQVTKFHAMKAPGIAIPQYLDRIHKYASCSNECFILALIYIDRLIQRSNFLLTELNVHRVIITAVLLAAKFFDDAYYNNAYYAKVGGVLVSEMNGLEVDFLFRINFSLHVSPDVFEKYRGELMVHSLSIPAPVSPPQLMTVPSHDTSMAMDASVAATIAAGVAQHVVQQHIQQSDAASLSLQTPGNIVPVQYSIEDLRAMQQITPSPTGEIVDGTNESADHFNNAFVAVHGANSAPPQQTATTVTPAPTAQGMLPYYLQQQQHAVAHASHSAQVVQGVPENTIQPYTEGPYVVVENQLMPIQNALVHHHHGGFHQRPASEAAAYNNAQQFVGGRMLTGMSGAGL